METSFFAHTMPGGESVAKEDMIDKRCEYEVQSTCGTENDYPQIAQGMAKQQKEALKKKEARWRKQ